MVWPIVAVAAVSMFSSMAAGSAAASASKGAAMRQAAMMDEQMQQEIERKKRAKKQIQGEIKATIYASGIDYAGSAKRHYETETQLMNKNLRQMERARHQTIRNIKKGADAAHGAAMWQVAASGISGAASAFGAMSRTSGTGGGMTAAASGGKSYGGFNYGGGLGQYGANPSDFQFGGR